MAVVISTVSTVTSEQERNGQGRRDVGKSVHVRQAIMQLDAYHVRRGFLQKTANKVVYNDGKRLLFAYPFLDVAALMDLLYISRSSACYSSYSPQSSPPQCDHIILTISLVFLCFFGIALFLLVLISSMVGFVYMSEITYFVFFYKVPDLTTTAIIWIGLLYVLSMILKIFPDIIYFQMHLCVSPCFVQGPRFTSMWQLNICTFIMRCLIFLFVAFHSFSMFIIFLNAIANLRMILFYLRQLLSMTQYILNYSPF